MVNLFSDPILAGNELQIISVLGFDLQDNNLVFLVLDQYNIAVALILYRVQNLVLLLDSVFIHQNNNVFQDFSFPFLAQIDRKNLCIYPLSILLL